MGALHVFFVVDHRSSLGDRVVLVEHGREDLVGHVDEVERGLCDLRGVCGDGSDAVAHVADLVVKAALVVRLRVGEALSTRGVADPWHVLVVEHRPDTRQRPGLCVVDGNDSGMGMGAVQHLGVEQTADLDVVDERRIPLGQLEGVDLWLGLADHRGLGHLRAGIYSGREDGKGGGVGDTIVGVERVGERRNVSERNVLHRLAAHCGPGAQDGMDRPEIAGLTVEHAGQDVASLRFGGIRLACEQLLGRQHLRRARVAGLHGARVDESLLDRMDRSRC